MSDWRKRVVTDEARLLEVDSEIFASWSTVGEILSFILRRV